LAKSVGSKLPEQLLKRLLDQDISAKNSRVIIFTTTDDNGWPHHGMLSYHEVVARDRTRLLMLTYSDSRSTKNLQRTGAVTLLFIDEEMSYYVKAKCRELKSGLTDAPNETLFEAEVVDVLEDRFPTARITSGIKFEGYDPGMSREARTKVFHRLLDLTRK